LGQEPDSGADPKGKTLHKVPFAILRWRTRREKEMKKAWVGVFFLLIFARMVFGEILVSPDSPSPGLLNPKVTFGFRVNSETVRAREIEPRIDNAKTAAEIIAALKVGWENPPATYRPHTRWWWPGNAVTKEGIDFQLLEMKDKGFGGVEIMSFLRVFAEGNMDFNSDEFVQLTKYAVDKARELGMHVTPALAPGWNHGHAVVMEEDSSKVMVYYETNVEGGHLSLDLTGMKPGRGAGKNTTRVFDALIAVGINRDGTPDTTRRLDLSALVSGKSGLRNFTAAPDLRVDAELPDGRWRLMSFWTSLTMQKCTAQDSLPAARVVDHFQKSAVENYLKNAGARFAAAIGGDYGQTVDSFFGDSFELHSDFSYWSTGLYRRFEKEKGYDLRPYLPLLVYGGAPETPYVRYDVGSFLSDIGMEALVRPLADYAAENHVAMRQQPHFRFVSDIIEQSGVYQRPETENTKRSFDPMLWHKLTTSGAWLYPSQGRKWVSAEAFTFINEKYRTSMEEIKRGTDLFLRDGITQFYNHGYFYTPEKELAPSRDFIWMNRISHVNTWWPWYRGLADYQARACFLSRQGRPECNVLVYAPYPTLWSERGGAPSNHGRDLPIGSLPKILISNGYDFDCVNDDLLMNHAEILEGKIIINGFDYSVLILPRAVCLSPETLKKIGTFIKSGGTVMALGCLPERSAGLMNHAENDAQLAELREELFDLDGGKKNTGNGCSWFFPGFEELDYPGLQNRAWEWSPTAALSSIQAEFIQTLRSCLTPDFEIADTPQSNGLTFRHTLIGSVDCWFICNLQPDACKTEVTLNTKGKVPQVWDAMDGSIQGLENLRFVDDGRVVIQVDLQPWASKFVLLTPPGSVDLPLINESKNRVAAKSIELSNDWSISFQGVGNFSTNLVMQTLTDWTKIKGLENFSGTAVYVTEFEISNSGDQVFIDLGEVHEVASVWINGQDAGKVWMSPYRLDISKQIKSGTNRLEITVANLLWNYAAGLEQPTPVPFELQAHYGADSSSHYKAWSRFQEMKKNHNRVPSGLLGPVSLQTVSSAPVVSSVLCGMHGLMPPLEEHPPSF